MRARGGIALGVAVLAIAATPAAANGDPTPWGIGAAKVDTTPPTFNMGQDSQDFPPVDPARGIVCPRSTYSGPRLWRFEEPYQDQDGSGDFSYPVSGDPGAAPAPEPFCDYNHNNRWDGIYLSGGANHPAKAVHDPIDARAVAFSDGTRTVALVSVVAQGIFENYIREARTQAQALASQPPHQSSCGHIDEMVVSSNHNESSPDTVGIYGAPEDPTGSFGVNSGIDEYYMDWLDEQMANAAVAACDNREPASLREVDFPVPAGLRQEIHAWPTTDHFGNATATDPKVRVLQARDASGNPIFTMMNLADHNQDIGQSDDYDVAHALSSDWPGYFHRRLEQDVGGMSMFLAADIGSMEDLITVPAIPGPPCFSGANGCYAQVEQTGNTIADDVAGELANAKPIPIGPVSGERTEFCVPLENNLFRAAFEAGIFGERQGYTNCQPTGRAGNEVHTSVAVLDVGADLQFIVNPGEAFPGLMLGSPWGIEDASCPARDNPPVPTWHASAKYRFQVGLGDDLIGYEKPAWSFVYEPPTFTSPDCNTDPHGHSHSLEGEAVGPAASNAVAEQLTDLLDQNPDPTAEIRLGRYVKADGTLTDAYTAPQDQGAPGHFSTDAVAIWLAAPGSTTLDPAPGNPDSGTIVALDGTASFGDRPVDANGHFMDFDGADEPTGPDIMTRGMLVKSGDGGVSKRYYVDVYPALTVSGSLGPATPYYSHPQSAPSIDMSLVPAFRQCGTPGNPANSYHAPPPLSVGGPNPDQSCNPPTPAAVNARVGSQSVGSAQLSAAPGDMSITVNTNDVQTPGGAPYDPSPGSSAGDLLAAVRLRITDSSSCSPSPCSAPYGTAATADDLDFSVPVDCEAGGPGIGSTCQASTTANAVIGAGAFSAGRQSVVQAFRIRLFDSANTLFEQQGYLVP